MLYAENLRNEMIAYGFTRKSLVGNSELKSVICLLKTSFWGVIPEFIEASESQYVILKTCSEIHTWVIVTGED